MRAAVVVLALALATARAHAFPQLTIRGQVPRCTMCHVSPGGGGMLNEYGRNEAGDTLSRGGDGRFLHGAWDPPDWLLLGGDLRAAALAYKDTQATEGTQLAAFPMQADLRAGVTAGGFTIVATGGLRGSTRLYSKSAADYFESSEHYAMYAHDSGIYVRAGKFFPTFGLRLPDHTLYTERYTGQDLFEEPYGGDAGYVGDDWEVHVAGFTRDPITKVGPDEAGGVLYAELHGTDGAIGLSARYGTGPEGARAIAGLSARVKAPGSLVLLGELDGIDELVKTSSGTTAVTQAIGLVALDQQLARGVNLLGWYEQYEESLGLIGAIHHDVGLSLELYLHAHWELITEARYQHLGPGEHVGMGMFQVHYYL